MHDPERLFVEIRDHVAFVRLNRERKANALDHRAWLAIGATFERLGADPLVRAIVLSGAGKNFTAGIDLNLVAEMAAECGALPEGHKQAHLRRRIVEYQRAVSAIERCERPVIAAIHGAGVDLATACDLRFATADAELCVKEVDLAIVADVGTLQRLPRIVGEGLARELCFTGRPFSGEEARAMGLVNRACASPEALFAAAEETARLIASKSPVAVRGIKHVMNWCRDRPVEDGLAYVATHNAGMLLSVDGFEAFAAALEKRAPRFADPYEKIETT